MLENIFGSLINFIENIFTFVVLAFLLMSAVGIGIVALVILLIVIAVLTRKKKSKLKFIPITLLILIVIGIGFFSNQAATQWHRELYVLEGSSYVIVGRFVAGDKEYTVAGEKIELDIYTQTSDIDIDKVKTYTGPYKMRVIFEKGIYGDGKEIIIHDMTVKSDDGSDFPMSFVKFPLEIRFFSSEREHRDGKYQFKELVEGETIVSYTYLFRDTFDFDFEKKEEIFITLDVEVRKNEKTKREEIILKLVPVLDKGKKVYPPSV